MATSWTQTDLDAIEEAIASGELSVQFGDNAVRYRSIPELLQARDTIKQALAAASATTVLPKQSRVVTRKGW